MQQYYLRNLLQAVLGRFPPFGGLTSLHWNEGRGREKSQPAGHDFCPPACPARPPQPGSFQCHCAPVSVTPLAPYMVHRYLTTTTTASPIGALSKICAAVAFWSPPRVPVGSNGSRRQGSDPSRPAATPLADLDGGAVHWLSRFPSHRSLALCQNRNTDYIAVLCILYMVQYIQYGSWSPKGAV